MTRTTCILIVALMTATSASAQDLLHTHLDFGSLPSAQGWSFASGFPEADYCSVDGSALTIDTMGLGYTATARAYYWLDVTPQASAGYWSFTINMRLLASESYLYPDGHYNAGGCFAGLQFAGKMAQLRWKPGALVISDDLPSTYALDVGDWHEYQVIGDVSTATFSVYVDDQLLHTGPMWGDTGSPRFHFGDGTSGGNAHMEISHVELLLSDLEPIASEELTWGGVKALFR